MKQKTVVILGDSFNNTLGLIRSLGEAGASVILILVGNDRLHVSKSRYANRTIPCESLDDCNLILKQKELLGSYLICTNDNAAKWVDDNEEWLSINYHTPMRGQHIGGLFDKPEQCELAEKFGIIIPKSVRYERNEPFPDNLSFPILIKPANSNGGDKSDIHICHNRNELDNSLAMQSSCGHFIMQEYIIKDFEINLIGIATDKGAVIPGGIKKLRHYPNIYSACSYGLFLDVIELGIDADPIERMIESTGYRGPFSVEFLRKGDRSYFLEVNFRHDGLAYAATAAGVNLMKMYLDGKPSSFTVRPTYMMDLSSDYCHVKDGKLSRFVWFRDFLRTGCQLNFNCRDPKPTLQYYFSKFGLV